MINPGTQTILESREDLAAATLNAFLTAVWTRAAELEQAPQPHQVAALTG